MVNRMQRGTTFLTLGVGLFVMGPACTLHRAASGVPKAPRLRAMASGPVHRTTGLSVENYRAHIALLAHDDLRGRGMGSDGIDLAAGYVAGQFAAAGLLPGGPTGTYFQEFVIPRDGKILDDTSLSVDDSDLIATLRTDFIPFSFSATGSFHGEVVFVGYGIDNPDKGHRDYSGIDVRGKVLLMLRREPPAWRTDETDGSHTSHALFPTKMALAEKNGAAAVLIVNQNPGEDGVDALRSFTRQGGPKSTLPAMHVKRAYANRLLAAGGLDSLTKLQQRLDDGVGGASAALDGVRVRGTVAYESVDMMARNVIGLLPGTGPDADEFVVIGAHYDHLGERRGEVFNGADDNASGTAGVMELAWSLARAPSRNRSVLFIAFTGEEIGLLGSEHFVSHPTVPLDSIAAMINLDMIGRLNHAKEENMLAVQGLGTGASFKEIVERRAASASIPFLPDDSAKGPSDHASFYRAAVPALFFFTGVHADYHQPGDDMEKINVEGAVQIVELVREIASDLIRAERRPQFVEVPAPARIFRGANPFMTRVVMGIMPDMEDDSEAAGWRVAEVLPGGGADLAGIRAGDRILQIADLEINGFSDYRRATDGKHPGDTVDVSVQRADKKLTLTVRLSARE